MFSLRQLCNGNRIETGLGAMKMQPVVVIGESLVIRSIALHFHTRNKVYYSLNILLLCRNSASLTQTKLERSAARQVAA